MLKFEFFNIDACETRRTKLFLIEKDPAHLFWDKYLDEGELSNFLHNSMWPNTDILSSGTEIDS